ncbi:MAG: hypothetical protein L3J74_08875 [Bacteroidales bacterium]|nr:hypothetical protein [Bacteroidales bacterium]
MAIVSLSKENKSIIVFHIWKSLPYNLRMLLSFFLIATGFLIQYYGAIFLGLMFIGGGNLLILVKGYDNRIKLGKYTAAGEWVKTDKEHLDQIVEMNKKLQKWDRSPFDISNTAGRALFFSLGISAFIILMIAVEYGNIYLQIFIFDASVLFIPHWFTGLKRVTTTPLLLRKIGIYNKILKDSKEELDDKKVSFMIYVKGENDKLPNDVKMKIEFNQQPEAFLGLYAQISLNNVQGKYYPYFYMVLVAKEEMNMSDKYFNQIKVSKPIIKEKSKENNMDIIVIRQYTTKTSGYHTTTKRVNKIFRTGLDTAEFILNSEI